MAHSHIFIQKHSEFYLCYTGASIVLVNGNLLFKSPGLSRLTPWCGESVRLLPQGFRSRGQTIKFSLRDRFYRIFRLAGDFGTRVSSPAADFLFQLLADNVAETRFDPSFWTGPTNRRHSIDRVTDCAMTHLGISTVGTIPRFPEVKVLHVVCPCLTGS